jgi:plastocyanin
MAFLTLAVLFSGCGAQNTQNQPVTTNEVDIQDFAFSPDSITVTKGTTVTWTNKDSAPHTVKGIGTVWTSETLNQGQTYNQTFNEAGTFEYECSIHTSMRGKVIVT